MKKSLFTLVLAMFVAVFLLTACGGGGGGGTAADPVIPADPGTPPVNPPGTPPPVVPPPVEPPPVVFTEPSAYLAALSQFASIKDVKILDGDTRYYVAGEADGSTTLARFAPDGTPVKPWLNFPAGTEVKAFDSQGGVTVVLLQEGIDTVLRTFATADFNPLGVRAFANCSAISVAIGNGQVFVGFFQNPPWISGMKYAGHVYSVCSPDLLDEIFFDFIPVPPEILKPANTGLLIAGKPVLALSRFNAFGFGWSKDSTSIDLINGVASAGPFIYVSDGMKVAMFDSSTGEEFPIDLGAQGAKVLDNGLGAFMSYEKAAGATAIRAIDNGVLVGPEYVIPAGKFAIGPNSIVVVPDGLLLGMEIPLQ